MRRLYLALLGLSGCAAPCEQDLTETTVMSQSGLALTAAQVVMEITTFQAWTSRPVCVATVEMRRPIRRGLRQVESLVTPDGTLLLDDRAGLDGVRHALCGHVDRGTSATTELIDIDRFESFVPIEQWDRYPTVELQRAEVLSSLCESGPDHFGALDALYDEQCGGGRYQTELVQWLHEQIFDEAGQPAYPARLVRGPPREWRKPADMSDAQVLIWLDGTWLLTGDVPVEEDDREDGLGIASDDPWTLLLPLEGLHSGSVGGTVTAGGTALLTLYQTTVSVSDNFVHSQTLAVLDPAARTLRLLDLPTIYPDVHATEEGYLVLTRLGEDSPEVTLRLSPAGNLLGVLDASDFPQSSVVGAEELGWSSLRFPGASSQELLYRVGQYSIGRPPEQLIVRDERGRPDRLTLSTDELYRVGDELWALHPRPDGRWALVVVDADARNHVIIDPCTLRGELHLADGVPWDLWDEGTRLVGTPLAWEPL